MALPGPFPDFIIDKERIIAHLLYFYSSFTSRTWKFIFIRYITCYCSYFLTG